MEKGIGARSSEFLVLMLISFVIFLSCTVISFSLTPLYDNYVLSGKTYEGITFTVNSDSVYLSLNGTFIGIDKNDCAFLYDKKICVKDIKNTASGYSSKIMIYKRDYDFLITRTFDKSDVFYGEIVNVTVNITNTGTLDAYDFEYIDSFPSEVEIITYKNGTSFGSNYQYVVSLDVSKSIIIKYAIRAKGKVDADLRSQIKIDNSNFYSSLSHIETKPSVEVYSNLKESLILYV